MLLLVEAALTEVEEEAKVDVDDVEDDGVAARAVAADGKALVDVELMG